MKKGTNLIGYSRAEMSIGEICRIHARSLDESSIPYCVLNFNENSVFRNSDKSLVDKEVLDPLYKTNIFYVNADSTKKSYDFFGDQVFNNRYNIGYWSWELPEFPKTFIGSFNYVDEVWVPSNFVLDSVSRWAKVPVIKIPHPISIEVSNLNREYFNLPEDKFLFLFAFDILSIFERKNPMAVIKVFKDTFKDNSNVCLVLKINNSKYKPEEMKLIEDSINNNIYILKDTLSKIEVNSLINLCDCFISLHRSEGFGLLLGEAMYLGKPVIATNWSGNIDFMSESNSCPVKYNLTKLNRTYHPYEKGSTWADPDIEHAMYYMKKVVEDKEFYNTIGSNAKTYIKNNLSTKYVGSLIKQRLNFLGLI